MYSPLYKFGRVSLTFLYLQDFGFGLGATILLASSHD